MHIENANCLSGLEAEISSKPSAPLFTFLSLGASPSSYNKLEDENKSHPCEFVTVKFSWVCTNWVAKLLCSSPRGAEPSWRSTVSWVLSLCVTFGTWPSNVGSTVCNLEFQALCSNPLLFIYPLNVAGTKIKTYMASVYSQPDVLLYSFFFLEILTCSNTTGTYHSNS